MTPSLPQTRQEAERWRDASRGMLETVSSSFPVCARCGAPLLGRGRGGVCVSCYGRVDRHGRVDRVRPTPARPAPVAAHWLRSLLDEGDFVVLDTETTGLARHAEVIEVGVIDAAGEVLIEQLVRPRSGYVPRAAARVHKLTMAHLKDAPGWPEVLPTLIERIGDRRVLAWNASFDQRMIEQSGRLWQLDDTLLNALPRFECAMRGYARVKGMRSCGLERAAGAEGVLAERQQHRSVGDARLTLRVLEAARDALRVVPRPDTTVDGG